MMWKALLIVLPLAGCVTTTDQDLSSALADRYTRADIDAMNATAQCKALARTLVQIARCDVRR
jgi:hypothetical protein